MKQSIILAIGIVATTLLLSLISLVAPNSAGPLGILAVFLLLYVISLCFIYLVAKNLTALSARIVQPGKWKEALEEVSSLKLYYYSSIIALAPVILLGMQSVGGVRLMDISLLIAFEVLACFYIYRRF